MFDSFVFAGVVQELRERLINETCGKIYQTPAGEIIIHFKGGRERETLLLSSRQGLAGIYLSERKQPHMDTPPPFCMQLRKHLVGARISSMEHTPWERVLTITFIRGFISYKLIAEITGKYSNIILVDEENTILGAFRLIPAQISRYRVVLPGHPYLPPPVPAGQNLENAGPSLSEEIWRQAYAGKSPEAVLVNLVRGLSPFMAREICLRALVNNQKNNDNNDNDDRLFTPDDLHKSLQEVAAIYLQKNFTPVMAVSGDKLYYSVLDCLSFRDYERKYYTQINKMLDDYYYQAKNDATEKQLRGRLGEILKKELKKVRLKRIKQEEELTIACEADKFRLYGEMLLAHLHQINPGQTNVDLPDLYDLEGRTISIPLNPEKSPVENATLHFHRYRRGHKGEPIIRKQLAETQTEEEYLESVFYSLEHTNGAGLEEIKTELADEGYLRSPKKAIRAVAATASEASPLTLTSSAGYLILVGRNNRQNDLITFRRSSRRDIWFHLQGMPGSHVLVKDCPYPPDADTLSEAAVLAAYFSQARNSSHVTVDYTERKNVSRHPSGKPGMAIYRNFKSVTVEPQKEIVEELIERSTAKRVSQLQG